MSWLLAAMGTLRMVIPSLFCPKLGRMSTDWIMNIIHGYIGPADVSSNISLAIQFSHSDPVYLLRIAGTRTVNIIFNYCKEFSMDVMLLLKHYIPSLRHSQDQQKALTFLAVSNQDQPKALDMPMHASDPFELSKNQRAKNQWSNRQGVRVQGARVQRSRVHGARQQANRKKVYRSVHTNRTPTFALQQMDSDEEYYESVYYPYYYYDDDSDYYSYDYYYD